MRFLRADCAILFRSANPRAGRRAWAATLLGGLLITLGNGNCAATVLPRPPNPQEWKGLRSPARGDYIINARDGSLLFWIPGGATRIGSNAGRPAERPAHVVRVAGFWLGFAEVTNQRFAVFWKESRASGPYPAAGLLARPELPVTGVTWEEATRYAAWAGLRLPTEAEWEHAARALLDLAYPTATGDVSNDLANIWGHRGVDRWLEQPAPPCSFPRHPLALCDLAGNVWEWTSSRYAPYPYVASDGREDPGSDDFRVLRGGSWQYGPRYARSSDRYPFRKHLRLDYAGFRVARSHHAPDRGADP